MRHVMIFDLKSSACYVARVVRADNALHAITTAALGLRLISPLEAGRIRRDPGAWPEQLAECGFAALVS